MPHHPQTEKARLSSGLRLFSCLICRRRKVRCDRADPCSNCTRAVRECSYIAPVRGKPKKRKAPKEGLHAKLKRYEEILRSLGVDIGPSDNGVASDTAAGGVGMGEAGNPHDESRDNHRGPRNRRVKLITKDGTSRYFDSDLWTHLGHEFHHPDQAPFPDTKRSDCGTTEILLHHSDENALVLNPPKSEDLARLHYPLPVLQEMLNIYLDRVDPLIKLLHMPSFATVLKDAVRKPNGMSRSLEALAFAFYLATIAAMENFECYSLLGQEKSTVTLQYEAAARQALINADFVNTSSIQTLQAYTIFLMGMKGRYQTSSLLILTGIAVRLARRMGLHRDGTLLSLSPFDTEIRRRLWHHIVHMDCRTSDYSGTTPSADLFRADTRLPLNIEDKDIEPSTARSPPEHTGITPIVLCLIKSEITQLLHRLVPSSSDDIQCDGLNKPRMKLTEKDTTIDAFEDTLERRYFRYHDPSDALHLFSVVMARYSVCKLRVFAHSPHRYAARGTKVPQHSRNVIFENSMKILECGNFMHKSPILRKFMWQIGTGYIWDTLLYLLIEIKARKNGPEVDSAWRLIGGAFQNYPMIFSPTADALHRAIGTWTLQVWDDCAVARKQNGLEEFSTPSYISALRARQIPRFEPKTSTEFVRTSWDAFNEVLSPDYGANSTASASLTSSDFSKLLSFDLEPNEWVNWELLFAGGVI